MRDYCFECKKHVPSLKKHLAKIPHKSKLYRQDYEKLCHFTNCMQFHVKNGYCKKHQTRAIPKKQVFQDIEKIKCPVCGGPINGKDFVFRSGNTAEFIAQCWSGDLDVDNPVHVFYFQIEMPECLIFNSKWKTLK